ncbi:siderophore ABC transporter substrate-binding protein [[Clostridium] colinum]|uniref:siderophore ABC transporter substrate-binding protein n=1 Tax=[Clostridium] colinum TaxID=36835 RepID=UPI002024FEF6|nr:siderophore ABC transporter substrate-binding protein [[Clostridium] colinum]
MKKLLTLSLTFLLASSLFGCELFKKSEPQNNTSTEANSQNTNESVEQEIVISHSKGETKVKTNPQKVVVFDMATLDTMNKLGVEADFALPLKNVPSYLTGYENSINAGSLKEPDLEGIYTFKPDVIFISGRQADFYDKLNEIAPTVYVDLDYKNYMESFKNNVTNIGKIFNKEDLALEEIKNIEAKIKEANEKIKNLNEKALVILTNNGKITAYGSGSRFGLIYDVLGFKQADENLYKEGEEATTHGKEVSFEYISQINPDILFVVNRNAVVSGEGDAKSTLNNELINNTNAAKNNKIIMLNPEAWYIVGNGLSSINIMIDDTLNALK